MLLSILFFLLKNRQFLLLHPIYPGHRMIGPHHIRIQCFFFGINLLQQFHTPGKTFQNLCLAVIVTHLFLTAGQLCQLIFNLNKGIRHIPIISAILLESPLDDLFNQQILHHSSGCFVSIFKIGPYMTFGFINSPQNFPMTFIKTITADEALVFALPLKDMNLDSHIPSAKFL